MTSHYSQGPWPHFMTLEVSWTLSLGSHNFMVTALGSCVKWPLLFTKSMFDMISSRIWVWSLSLEFIIQSKLGPREVKVLSSMSFSLPNCQQWTGIISCYTKYDIECHTVFYVTMVTFWTTLLMNKWSNIVMDDGRVHSLAKILPFFVKNLWWNIIMHD
jgi:hypothetical protein